MLGSRGRAAGAFRRATSVSETLACGDWRGLSGTSRPRSAEPGAFPRLGEGCRFGVLAKFNGTSSILANLVLEDGDTPFLAKLSKNPFELPGRAGELELATGAGFGVPLAARDEDGGRLEGRGFADGSLSDDLLGVAVVRGGNRLSSCVKRRFPVPRASLALFGPRDSDLERGEEALLELLWSLALLAGPDP